MDQDRVAYLRSDAWSLYLVQQSPGLFEVGDVRAVREERPLATRASG